jgi:aspartate/methionine/tyrosine aminotransferase
MKNMEKPSFSKRVNTERRAAKESAEGIGSIRLEDLEPDQVVDFETATGSEYRIYKSAKTGDILVVDMLVNKDLPRTEHTGTAFSADTVANHGTKVATGYTFEVNEGGRHMRTSLVVRMKVSLKSEI